MTFRRLILVAGMIGMHLPALGAELELFTTRDWPVTGSLPPGTQAYVLDDPDRLEVELSQGLPLDPQAAVEQARKALQSTWQVAGHELTHAYQGLHKAKRYRLDRVPALVVDGRPVALGAEQVQAVLKQYAGPGVSP
jgi:integrating conjugative element protein (TIGR03757 family)